MDLKRWIRAEWQVFLLAVQFLTRLPVTVDYTSERLEQTPRWYPAVGVLIGAMVAVIWWGSSLMFPPVVAAVICTAASVLITGVFHEDGFADACDGLGGGQTRARVLEIMRDSRLGTYGTLGLALMVGGKIAVLAALPAAAVPMVLVAGHAASRASAVWVIASSSYLRDHGTGKPVANGIDAGGMAVIGWTLLAVTLALLWVVPVGAVVVGAMGLAAGHYAMRRRFEQRLGGYTGDCLGAVQQCSEIGFLLGVLAVI
jgi:adenosylcobinamide-GDP ribazoletransferase